MIDNALSESIEQQLFALPKYMPHTRAFDLLQNGNILSRKETSQELLERVITTLFSIENEFNTSKTEIKRLGEEFAGYIVDGYAMLGTPILTNAGHNAALSSCVVASVDLRELNSDTEKRISAYYRQNMGSGFDFTQYDNPVELLNWVNNLSERETASGSYCRYIGNMGILHISHPDVKKYIDAKRKNNLKHFNISIDVTEDFMKKAENDELFALTSGIEINASSLLDQIAESTWLNGDPGLVFLERMNNDNPLAEISKYSSTPPCCEMGLAEGETCHFGYINLFKFVRNRDKAVDIDYEKLRNVTELMVRVLDNAIEYSIPRYPTVISADVIKMKRKIGIGVCGLADLLLTHNLPYDSKEARELARDVISFINYVSKLTSVALANQRESCLAMSFPATNKYLNSHFLESKYGMRSTRTVSYYEWEELANTIRSTRKLRNISTTALPPTGRSSILLDVTPSIEPYFSFFTHNGIIQKHVLDFLLRGLGENTQNLEYVCQEASRTGSFQNIDVIPIQMRECLKSAKEIAPLAHIQMVADLAGMHGVIDEGASKTVNLPNTATIDDIKKIFLLAFRHGLKNISVYRDKSKQGQPFTL